MAQRRSKKKSLTRDPRYLDFCARYRGDLVGYVLDHAPYRITWQQIDLLRAIQEPGCRVAVASGHGCFGVGTPIMLANGDIVPIEDVSVGGVLIGDDGTARNVLRLCRGREELYQFEYMDGTSHVFNESHILCLVATQSHGRQKTGDKVTVTVREWLKWSERRQRTHAIYRVPVVKFTSSREPLLIPPYILGLWLGDGTSVYPEFTIVDQEIIDALRDYTDSVPGYDLSKINSAKYAYRIRNDHKINGGFYGKLKHYNLIHNKHIPLQYKTASFNERLSLLAGLIDTDGTLDQRGRRVLSIVQKRRQLAEDIVFIARSVGIHASIRKIKKTCCNNGAVGTYYNVSITRNIENIPIRLKRKQPEINGNKQRGNLHFGIRKVTPMGEGEYFGFELDGNHKFLGGDFTVLHNTGKSWLLAYILDWHLRAYPYSNALLTATNVEQVRSVTWKYLDEAILNVDRVHPWMAGWFIKETKRYYMRLFKDSWYAIPKTASKGAPENVAGQHNDNYLCIVDEASGVEDEIHGVLRGALTHEDNRYVMVSQPTRPIGHFADAFGKLSDLYTTFNLNAELSPIVSKKFIREKLIEYGGHHSPEYQIKVLGCLPDNLTGYLIPKRWLEICQGIEIQHDESWGWVVTVDVAEGVHRDSSVWTIGKVSGYYENRKVEVVECREFLDLNEKEFARKLYHRCLDLPSVTIAVDGDGAGRTVILELDELGMQCEAIHWGLPCHSEADKRRYRNQRAYASVKVREATFDERIKIAATKKIVEEGAKIPYDMDERGRYAIWTKERMRGKGIKSPDVWDTHCFFYLVDYIPVEAAADDHSDDMIKWAREILTGDPA